MKILLINLVCGIKSTGRICTDIARELEKNGNEVKIAYGRETVPAQDEKYAVRIGSELDVKVSAAKSRILDNAGFDNKKATEKFIEWVKEYDPDVIHLHNLHGYYINCEILFNYLKTCGKKIIWTLHDCWPFTGHCAHFTYSKCDKWKTGCSRCPEKGGYPKSMFLDRSDFNYKTKRRLFTGVPGMTLVTPSAWLAELVKQSFLKDYDVEVIHNGIDTGAFYPTESNKKETYGLGGKKIILGVAAVWNSKKGFDDFIKLAGILDDEYRIVLIGVSEEQKRGLPDNIIGISRTDSVKELAEWYTAADVLFNPTYEDNYPTVNLEAQMCGTPVVTYRTGGSVESVPESNVVEVGRYEDVLKVLNNAQIKKDDYSKETMLAGYMQLFMR